MSALIHTTTEMLRPPGKPGGLSVGARGVVNASESIPIVLRPRPSQRRSWVPAAAPIGTGDDLHEVTIWIFEIDAPASIVMVDLLLFRLCGVGPIPQPAFAYSPEYLVELCFTDQEGVVLRGDLFPSVNKIDVCVIIGPNDLKRPPLDGPRQTQYPREKSRRRAFVAGSSSA